MKDRNTKTVLGKERCSQLSRMRLEVNPDKTDHVTYSATL